MLSIKINKDELVKGVGLASNIAEKKSALPILANILLETGEGRIKLTATDMEITFQGSYEAEVLSQGKLTVPARKLNDLVRLLNANEVTLQETQNYSLSLTAGRFANEMFSMPPDDFPQMPSINDINFAKVATDLLINAIEKTIYSVSVEEARYNLSGIYFEKFKDEQGTFLRLVSTDGHRLNITSITADGIEELYLPAGVLVSKKGLMELKKMADSSDSVMLGFNASNLVAKTEHSVLVMKLLEGRFPDYNTVLPKNNEKITEVNRKDLLDALKRISIMNSDDYKAVKFHLKPGQLIVSSINPELGKAEEVLEVKYSGDELEAGFNPRFYIEALSNLSSESVVFAFSSPSTPCLLHGADDLGYIGVIMSMKL